VRAEAVHLAEAVGQPQVGEDAHDHVESFGPLGPEVENLKKGFLKYSTIF